MAFWNENKPSGNDIPNAALASLLTSNKQAFREGIEKQLFWTQNSGLSAGLPVFSSVSTGPGATRAFYDVASNTSSALTQTKALDGRLYITSDTKRFFGYLSSQTVPLGSVDATVWSTSSSLAAASMQTIQTDTKVLVQGGITACDTTATGGSVNTVAFTTAYSATPFVQAVSMSTNTTNFNVLTLISSSITNFSVRATTFFGNNASAVTVLWRSHGTVAL